MDRIVEPEIMSDPDQVQSYYDTDREQYKYLFKIGYVSTKKQVPNSMIDLGCGPGDLTLDMAKLHPTTKVVGVDSSKEMLSLAKTQDNVEFKNMSITDVTEQYDRVISSMTLHHFHNPMDFWNSIKRISPKDVYIVDLLRPKSEEDVQELVAAKECSDLFKIDFENSLRAAFTIDEIKEQLKEADLNLTVLEIDQFHLKMDLVLIVGAL